MTSDQLAKLEPLLRERLELAVGRTCELTERVTGKRLDDAERAELRDLLAWELGMACSCGIAVSVER